MVAKDGGLTVAERFERLEKDVEAMKAKIRQLELSWAKATGIIVTAMVILKFVPWGQ